MHQRLNHQQMRLIRDSNKLPDMIWDDDEQVAHRSQICHGCATEKMVESLLEVSRESFLKRVIRVIVLVH